MASDMISGGGPGRLAPGEVCVPLGVPELLAGAKQAQGLLGCRLAEDAEGFERIAQWMSEHPVGALGVAGTLSDYAHDAAAAARGPVAGAAVRRRIEANIRQAHFDAVQDKGMGRELERGYRLAGSLVESLILDDFAGWSALLDSLSESPWAVEGAAYASADITLSFAHEVVGDAEGWLLSLRTISRLLAEAAECDGGGVWPPLPTCGARHGCGDPGCAEPGCHAEVWSAADYAPVPVDLPPIDEAPMSELQSDLAVGIGLVSSFLYFCDAGNVRGQRCIGAWLKANPGGVTAVVQTLCGMACRTFSALYGSDAVSRGQQLIARGIVELTELDPSDEWVDGYYAAPTLVQHFLRSETQAGNQLRTHLQETPLRAWGTATGLADMIIWGAGSKFGSATTWIHMLRTGYTAIGAYALTKT